MVTRLYLIRHGETQGADTKRYKGHIDVPLSENGIKQVERLAEYIYQNTEHRAQNTEHRTQNTEHRTQNTEHRTQSTELKAIYCSDLSRAIKSAEIIAEPHSIKPVVFKDLRERNFGIWEGMTFDEIKEKYPEEFNAWANNPLKFSPMQGESTIEVKERALKVFSEIIEKHKEQCIAMVAHGGINRIILCHLLGIPLENIFRIEQDFAAVNIIEFYDEYPTVKLINFTL
jgi:broad specificity phosphatase PhoE